jgi:DHA3 family macrolide efflux protein-like MFS transporter
MKHRSFLLLWVGKLISTAGSALTTLAASILVYRMTGSALSVGLMLIATVLPSIAIGLFAGVLVDRFDRKKIMLVSDLLRALLSFLIPFMVVRNQLWLYGIVMLSSAVGQFFNPAEESILPEIAGGKELSAANSLMAISGFACTAAGFALCGWITSRYPLQWAFYLDALSFLFSMLCIWQIPIPQLRSHDRSNFHTITEDLRSGRRYLQGNARLCSLFYVTIPAFLAFGLWNSLLLPFTLHVLHASSLEYGIQEGLTSVGFIAGSLTVMKLGSRVKDSQWIILSFIGMGVIGVSYALSADIPLAIVLVAITGLLNAPCSVARRLVIQRNTTREIRGRINSIFFVVRDIAYVAGMATAGLADLVSIRSLIVISALLWVAAGMWSLWKHGRVPSPRILSRVAFLSSLASSVLEKDRIIPKAPARPQLLFDDDLLLREQMYPFGAMGRRVLRRSLAFRRAESSHPRLVVVKPKLGYRVERQFRVVLQNYAHPVVPDAGQLLPNWRMLFERPFAEGFKTHIFSSF